ncbi:hypothetical protein ACB092_01G145500 [Castanea dentata]
MTNTTSLEEQVSTIAQTLEELMKFMKEREALRDAQITLLMDKMGNTSGLNREDESSRLNQTHNDKIESSTKDLNFSTDGQASIAYAKPYTQRIDLLRMPQNYQPPNTRHTVSMIELTNSKQWKEEPVIDYIQRWRNLSLDCKDQLSEASAIEMCIQGMNWGISYILQGIKPKTFEELATRAHDMELSIVSNGHQGPPVQEPHKGRERQDTRKGGRFPPKPENKQSLIVTTAPLKVPIKSKMKEQMPTFTQDKGRRRPTLQEMQEKQYPFPDSDISNMLDHLLELKLIELPEMKRPKEADQTNDPKYCKYHRLIGHPIERCFVLKDKIMELAYQGKITFDDEVVTSNLAMVASTTTSTFLTIQFGSFEPIEVKVPFPPIPILEISDDDLHRDEHAYKDEPSVTNEEGWTLVTRRKNHKAKYSVHAKESPKTPYAVKRPTKVMKPRIEVAVLSLEGKSVQSPRQPVTLQEFIPRHFQDYVFASLTCYQISDEEESDCEEETERAIVYKACWSSIIFTDDDRLLGPKIHNRPLFVTGYIREQRVNRILIDGGSAVNILPLKILKELGISLDELLPTIGKIRLQMLIGEMESSALFHIIDAKTTYKMLIGRPWLHEYGVVPSTYHQCLKYFQDGQNKFVSKWDGPYVVQEAYTNGAYKLVAEDGLRIGPINSKFLKRYYA